jgi:hypothetical protein
MKIIGSIGVGLGNKSPSGIPRNRGVYFQNPYLACRVQPDRDCVLDEQLGLLFGLHFNLLGWRSAAGRLRGETAEGNCEGKSAGK